MIMVMRLMWRDGNMTMMLGLEVMPMIAMMLVMVMIMAEMMGTLVMMLVVMVTMMATSTNLSELADDQSPLYLV